MHDLTIIEMNGTPTVDSRIVAEWVDKRHADLLRDIENYSETIAASENANLRSRDFFIPATYNVPGQNREYPCFLLTRKGCDMVANKMTGPRGIVFTAAYVTKFEEMEKAKHKPMTQLEMIATMAAEAARQERMIMDQGRQIAALTDTATRTGAVIEAIKETVIVDPAEWRKWINGSMTKISQAIGQDEYRTVRTESYRILDERAHTNLKIRLENLRMRMAREGRRPTDINETNRLDVIEADPKLREIYTAIVKEFRIKYIDANA